MPTPRYGDYQWDIYLPGLQGKLPKYPVDYPSLERAAAEVLPSWVYFYVGYGAGDVHTQQANIEAFELQLCGGAKWSRTSWGQAPKHPVSCTRH